MIDLETQAGQKCIISGSTAFIKLSDGPKNQGYWTVIDAADLELVTQYKWCVGNTGTNNYVMVNDRADDGSCKTLYLHRVLLSDNGMIPRNLEPDHINRDPMDNRRSNLRLIKLGDNRALTSNRRKRTSAYRGVTRGKTHVNYKATVIVNGVKYSTKSKSEHFAALMYDRMLLKATKGNVTSDRLNFPESRMAV